MEIRESCAVEWLILVAIGMSTIHSNFKRFLGPHGVTRLDMADIKGQLRIVGVEAFVDVLVSVLSCCNGDVIYEV